MQGFTLIELLVVVSLIAILTGFLVPGFNTYSENQSRTQAQEQVKSDLRSVQNNALSGVGSDGTYTHWGIRFYDNAKNYSYFKATGTNYSANCLNTTEPVTNGSNLPRNILIRNGPICVFFSYENGDVTFNDGSGAADGFQCNNANPTNCVITVGFSDNTSCEAIELNTAGLIRARSAEVSCEY